MVERWGQIYDMLPYLQAAYFFHCFVIMRVEGMKIIERFCGKGNVSVERGRVDS